MHKTGQIDSISKEENINQYVQRKQTVIVKTVEDNPQFFPIDFFNDNVDKLKGFKVGQNVKIECQLRGRKSEKDGKTGYFLSLNGYSITNF